MGRPRGYDMEDAIAAATRLFWRGYEQTSLADLTGTLGLSPASFYHAFGSKEALFRLVVDRYIAFQTDAFERAFRSSTTQAGIRTLLYGYVDVVTDPAHAPGCLVVNSHPSLEDGGDALRWWLAGFREALRIGLEDRFLDDRARGTLPDGLDPGAMARFVVTLAGGLAVEARSGAGRQELYAVVELAMRGFADPRAVTHRTAPDAGTV